MNNDEYYNDEEFQEILKNYEQAVSNGQSVYMDVDDLADIAEYYQGKGMYDEAHDAIERAFELDPKSTIVLCFKIHDALYNDNIEAAEEYLENIIDRESPEYVYSKAEILIAKEEIDEADSFLREKYVEVPPDEHQDFVLDAANLYSDYGYDEKAMEWMMRAHPDNTEDFKELMAHTLLGLGKYEDSERIFNELIDRDPFEKRYWNALASAQFMNEDYSASVTSSEYAIAIDPDDPEGMVAKANGLYRLENYEEALKYYERYSEKIPDDEFGFLHQGTCLINMGRYEEAVERLLQAERISPPDSYYLPEIYQEIAFAYSELRQLETALNYIDKTDNLDCDHIDMEVIKGHILLANDRYDEAEKMFKKAISDSGNAPRTLLRVIVSLYDNHYIEAAYKMFNKFFTFVNDGWTEGYAYMALCCWDLKRYDEFMDYLKTACKKNPTEARLVLARLFPDGMRPDNYYSYMDEKLKN